MSLSLSRSNVNVVVKVKCVGDYLCHCVVFMWVMDISLCGVLHRSLFRSYIEY